MIGDLSAFEPRLRELIFAAQQHAAHNDRLHLTVAANYGGRWDILQATRAGGGTDLAAHPERIDEAHLSRHLSMSWAPEPDLFIRTGGEQRISNFLIWQMACAEFYFTDRYWLDFGAAELQAAFDWYRTRSAASAAPAPKSTATTEIGRRARASFRAAQEETVTCWASVSLPPLFCWPSWPPP